MRKFWIAIGAVVGFVFGSRAGRGPYERLESKARTFTGRSDVQEVAANTKRIIQHKVDETRQAVNDKVNVTVENVRDLAAAPGHTDAEVD